MLFIFIYTPCAAESAAATGVEATKACNTMQMSAAAVVSTVPAESAGHRWFFAAMDPPIGAQLAQHIAHYIRHITFKKIVL